MATQQHHTGPEETGLGNRLVQPIDRRLFMRYTGLTACATGLLLAGCDDDDDDMPNSDAVKLGSGDIGVLNYAYALEQLEAAFYAQVVATPYSGITADERAIMQAIAKHEAVHRDFFKAALANNAIKGLTPDFSKVNFNDRTSVLTTARTFEDLGVAAYNGAGPLLQSTAFLTLAGKIVSVEARHAAVIRDLISNGTFANDVVNAQGLDQALSVSDVLTAAQPFIKDKIDGSQVGR
ncbi:ferritin-like domain-containing protein [Solirubrum puertoriconensis]|uniref:Tat (Twin-arginine translocation) pathway signal sequence containing protein n=1 Tax=Solirubrum puertoriconensis TaxID=1751427 RepID=A0A9X0HIR6_SOLP1|nr:ferritin-like domain-containing protein [Solirubrum puertoriconensis]KUG06596.1 Tat (twin-arginine translocation) pathway signal sequence containing protein [Solirubrum puertoriconensis]